MLRAVQSTHFTYSLSASPPHLFLPRSETIPHKAQIKQASFWVVMKEVILFWVIICLAPNTVLFMMIALCYLMSLIKHMCVYRSVSECVSLGKQGKTELQTGTHSCFLLFTSSGSLSSRCAWHCLEPNSKLPPPPHTHCTYIQISALKPQTFKHKELCLLAVNS